MNYKEYLKSPQWQAKRLDALRRAKHRCQVCDSEESLNVHHRTYVNIFDEEPEDLTVLCRRCHSLFHDYMSAEPDDDYTSPYHDWFEQEVLHHQTKKELGGPVRLNLKPNPGDLISLFSIPFIHLYPSNDLVWRDNQYGMLFVVERSGNDRPQDDGRCTYIGTLGDVRQWAHENGEWMGDDYPDKEVS